jgi:hypothetical protein
MVGGEHPYIRDMGREIKRFGIGNLLLGHAKAGHLFREKQTGRITRSAPSLDRVQQPEGTTI